MSFALRVTVWLILAGWFGSLGLFAFIVAPTAFSVLPSSNLAGELVSPILRNLNYYGMAAGIALALLSLLRGRSIPGIAVPLILALICAVSELALNAAIGEVLPSDLDPSSAADAAKRFSDLHQLSRRLFIATWVGTIVLIIVQVRVDATGAAAEGRN